MEYKQGEKLRKDGKDYIVYCHSYDENYVVVNLETGKSENIKIDGTEDSIIGTYTVDNTIMLNDVKVGDKFKYNKYTYVKIDPIRVQADEYRVYTAKCVSVDRSCYEYDIGRGFCIPLDKMVERVKD